MSDETDELAVLHGIPRESVVRIERRPDGGLNVYPIAYAEHITIDVGFMDLGEPGPTAQLLRQMAAEGQRQVDEGMAQLLSIPVDAEKIDPTACLCGGHRGWYEGEEGDMYCSCPAGQRLRETDPD